MMKCDKTLRLYPALLEYDLGEHVRAFSTTRQGGVSVGAYASFNANLYCGMMFNMCSRTGNFFVSF